MSIAEMCVSDLMTTDVQQLQATDRLDFADAIMRLQRFRHLPVAEDGKLVGLVSNSDILRAQVSSVKSSLTPDQLARAYEKITVNEIMTRDVKTIGPADDAYEAASILRDQQIGCLPVVESGRIVGIITASDFLDLLIEQAQHDALNAPTIAD